MPTRERESGDGFVVDAQQLAARLRGIQHQHHGAHLVVAMERVGSMPTDSAHRAFRFGQAVGIVRGVLGAFGLDVIEVAPQSWKRHFGLLKTEKDAARILAMQHFPRAALHLLRKKDGGRADALLIAAWALETEAYHPATDRPADHAPA